MSKISGCKGMGWLWTHIFKSKKKPLGRKSTKSTYKKCANFYILRSDTDKQYIVDLKCHWILCRIRYTSIFILHLFFTKCI